MKKLLVIITTAVLLAFPNVNFGQAPNLGSAAGFVLFSTNGAVSNTGISQVTGHVGTNVGASTGFGNVNGNMNDQNPASALCATDLLLAYGQLNAAIPGFFPAPLLGNGQTLTAGTYSISSAATMNLNLILDAQNNANAVFIFQISGAFSTNPSAKVILLNGAKACNVYWKIEGLVSMGAGTKMRGTIVANNAAIVIGAGDTLEGRALAINGAVSVNGVMAFTPIGCGSPFLTGPIAPTLASAACYALFSTNGAVNNAGVTIVKGDIGTNNGTSVGYVPLDVTGTIHLVPDGSTAACAADLNTAYIFLNTLPTDILLLYPAQFGNGLVLTPHTYQMNAAAALTDSLYLNALGNPNAVFVIRVNGAFATAASSKVVLINGAQSKNVYWKVEGAVTFNAGSIFKGTVVANNGAIIFNSGVYLDGRALTTTGALSTAAATVAIPSSINNITAPSNQTVCSGNSATFTIAATGSGLTYQWRKGTVNLSNGGNISGATSGTLIINPATITDAALNYNVVITGACASNYTSTNVALTINPSSTITSQPSNQIVCPGNSATFTVAVTGSGLTYQWRKGTINLINGGNISGATSATLVVNPVGISDAALNYNVVITGVCNPTINSANASLILNNPNIINEPTNQFACSGTSATFTVSATGSTLVYQWRKGTVNLINGGNISGATSATLIINPVNIADLASNYNVVITGACAPNDTSINVSLSTGNPNIINEPSNQFACTGTSATFTVSVTGSALVYQWRKGNVNLVNGGNISGATSATLIINPVNLSDMVSNYNVFITGACAPNDTSINVSLNTGNPNIITEPVNQTTCPGNSIAFTVSATGSTLVYQWRKGIVNLINGGNISGATSATLMISPISLADAATNYNVVISGACAPNDTSINVALSVSPQIIAIAGSNSVSCIGTAINFTAQAVSGGNYNWTGPNSFSSSVQNPTILSAAMINSGTYSLTISNGNCAPGSTTVLVIVNDCVTDFFIPEGFSPNGDVINDLFVVRGILSFPSNTFVVYNRWGDKVFSANPYQNTWDGKTTEGLRVGGDELPVGTYFYLLDLGNNTPVYKGTIYLNR